jgi:predicted ATPase/class 3 adenylate cyclase
MPQAERRQLTVLVCRLVGAAGWVVALDPEALHEVAEDYDRIGAEVVRRFDGYLVPQDRGDRLVVYFGYPRAHEDDARRAVYTGLGLVEAMAELNRRYPRAGCTRLGVRVGIHTGVVVVGARGRNEREAFALGNTSAIADQVQGLAVPDTVVVSPTTLRLVEREVEAQALGTYILEDPAEPVAVYQILQGRAARNLSEVAVTQGLIPLVGREHEVGLLCERWAQVKDGLGQVVLLSGEAGIGKSRLVQALTEHLTGEAHTRIESHCLPYYQNTAFYPVVTYLQELLRLKREDTAEERLRKLEETLEPYGFILREVVPLLAALLSLPLPDRYPSPNLPPQRQKQKTLEALLAWLLAEAERQPVYFIMEDLHWVDASTLEWLSLLIDQVSTARLLVLLTFRPDFRLPWPLRSHLPHLTLSRLTHRQVEVMVERVAEGKVLPAAVLQQLVSKADGVPLFVEELTKMVLESGLVKEREGRYELTDALPPLAIPATLQDSLMARLDRLGTAKQVVQLGAVAGREFTYEVIRAVSPVNETTLQQELTRLVDAELLYQRGLPPQARYVFKHALIQEAAYQTLLRRTRQQYHRQIAQLFEKQFFEITETQPELLARHYTEAGLTDKAIAYWQKAGLRAIERSANIEAVSHLTKGLEGLETLPETPERAQQELTLQLALGVSLKIIRGHTAPDVERAYIRAHKLCQQVGENSQLFLALGGLWQFYLDQGRCQKARELGEQSFALAQRMQDSALLQQAHFMLGATLFYLGELVSARAHFEQAVALYDFRQERPLLFNTGTNSKVESLSFLSWTLWLLGYPDQALHQAQKAFTLAQELSHAYSLCFTLHFTSTLHAWRREIQWVQEKSKAVITLASEHGFARWLAGGNARRGWALVEQGMVEEGIAQLQQGLTTWRAMGGELGLPGILSRLAEVYGKCGRAEAGLDVVAEALALVHKNQEHYYEAELHRLTGELVLRTRRDDQEAEASFHHALEVARRQQAKSWELRAGVSLSRLWHKQGKHDAAYKLLSTIYGWFREGFATSDLQEAQALLETFA